MVFIAGLFPAALQAFGIASKMLRVRALGCFVFCLQSLSKDLSPAAIAWLLERNVVELTVQELVDGGGTVECMGTSMLLRIIDDPQARDRMYAPEMIDTLMQWIGTWILKVRHVILPQGKSDKDQWNRVGV